ncbi:MAG: deoxyribodipyrimidine photo-lyase [Candidatus Thorarchaeota archaeon]|nr:deoxyribodipyrimidine photo-lyase [Candidatus Thorarchaeota archaeon]
MIHEERVRRLNSNSIQDGDYILYWMQASQRTGYNHALEHAIQLANKYELPLVVYFGLTDRYPEANERSYLFLLEGLVDAKASLTERNVTFAVRQENPSSGVLELAKECSLLVVDRDYQRLQRFWRTHVAASVRCPMIQVESNVIVPVEVASPKEEYSAGTFRPKIYRELNRYLQPVAPNVPLADYSTEITSLDIKNAMKFVGSLSIDRSAKGVDWLKGGQEEAKKYLSKFISEKLDYFDRRRNDPSDDLLSQMSPYLHFGQISPLEIALRIMETGSEGAEAYLEELIVRRELSMNFVYYNPRYDSIECLPNWAKITLRQHATDKREYLYSQDEFEFAETHDSYWNAAQVEMTKTGKMHGYMRMYWGKKILEWSKSPSEAYDTALYLNNRYELDGRDPNGYAGVAWCFGKHDRAWKERLVFGKVRYMNARGLERKFDIEAYVRRVS